MTEVEMAAARRVYEQQTDMSDEEMREICPGYKPPKKPDLLARLRVWARSFVLSARKGDKP